MLLLDFNQHGHIASCFWNGLRAIVCVPYPLSAYRFFLEKVNPKAQHKKWVLQEK